MIELHNGADSRLTQALIQRGLLPALDQVERHWRDNWRAGREKKDDSLCKGALIIVGNRKQDKFFSNGAHPRNPDQPYLQGRCIC